MINMSTNCGIGTSCVVLGFPLLLSQKYSGIGGGLNTAAYVVVSVTHDIFPPPIFPTFPARPPSARTSIATRSSPNTFSEISGNIHEKVGVALVHHDVDITSGTTIRST
jgi:hypothetical protein